MSQRTGYREWPRRRSTWTRSSCMADGWGTRRSSSSLAWACLGPLASTRKNFYELKFKSRHKLPHATHFALCHGVEALEGVVGRVVDVEELLEAGDHVFVALANGMWTGSSWIGADDFIVDDIEVVVHLFWSAVRTVVKSDAAVTLLEDISNQLQVEVKTSVENPPWWIRSNVYLCHRLDRHQSWFLIGADRPSSGSNNHSHKHSSNPTARNSGERFHETENISSRLNCLIEKNFIPQLEKDQKL